MKELTIEQKAQRYDEALQKARTYYNKSTCLRNTLETLENIFLELKESEDERIRKNLIELFHDTVSNDEIFSDYGLDKTEVLAWLEKQKDTDALIQEASEKSYTEGMRIERKHWLEKQGGHLENYDEAEKEKADFVGNEFIECCADFLDFKKGNAYWLEYICDDKYNVRSDNLFGKTYHITPYQLYTVFKKLTCLEKQGEPEDKGEISDGYHTFNELYYYRMLYNAAFFNLLPKEWVHKSKKHHDGEECFGGGWFIVMAELPTGQISNHYELKDWDLFQIPEKEVADEWDGHTPQKAAERLHRYLFEKQGEKKPVENKGMNLVEEEMTPFQKKVFCIIDTAIEEEQGLKQVCDELLTLASNEIKQKPAEWSEEDEDYYDAIITKLEVTQDDAALTDNQMEFLKSLKGRVRPKQEWSEEDEVSS